MKQLPQRWLLPLGFTLTDETFLVAVERYRQPDASPYKHWYQAGSAAFMYLNWQLCTWIGIAAGTSLPNPASWGLDFALVVTFIGMLIPGLRSRPMIACAIVAGATAVLLSGLPNRLGLDGGDAGRRGSRHAGRARRAVEQRPRLSTWPGNGQMSGFEVLMVVGMMAVTFGVRYPVLALVSRLSLPPAVLDALKFIPPAVLTAIVVPAVLMPARTGELRGLDNAYLVAGVAAALISWRTKNLLLTIVLGMAIFLGWRWLFWKGNSRACKRCQPPCRTGRARPMGHWSSCCTAFPSSGMAGTTRFPRSPTPATASGFPTSAATT